MPESFVLNFTATGIGSLPHLDAQAAVEAVAGRLIGMPYWPQLPLRSPAEHMNLQYARALRPLVEPDLAKRTLKAHPNLGREEVLAAFYERLLGAELADFALSPAEAAGLFAFLDKVGGAASARVFPWLKGHVTGPLTLAVAVLGLDGKALLYDDELAEALAKGLGAAAAAQVAQLALLGRSVMVFVDEPMLSGYGSAFNPVSREKVLTLLGLCLEECRERVKDISGPGGPVTVVMGVHCCGNTDWSLLIDAGFDVISLDSAGFGAHLLLYSEALARLYARGGAVAWGAVPTALTGQETARGLWDGLTALLEELAAKGFDRATMARQALVTPACGLGSLTQDQAEAVLELTRQVSELARDEFA